MASGNNIEALREARGWKRPELARRMGTSTQQVERLEKGQRRLSHEWMERAGAALGVSAAEIIATNTSEVLAKLPVVGGDDVETVAIEQIDLSFGLGGTIADSNVEVDVLHFPKMWIDSITRSPPHLLTWTRGKGDSMEPTIHDGDLVLIDRSKTDVREQDAMWAFTVGDVAAIKRLRVKGDRYQILSDNPSVPDDEEPIDFVNVVARVIFVGKKK